MLTRFSVKNFKNFNDEFIFDLTDTKSYEFNENCIQNGVVSKSIIYGHNGIGKTNLALAIFDIILHLTDKFRNMGYYSNYLNIENGSEIAEFRYKFKFKTDNIVEYRYGKKKPDELVYETLLINNKTVLTYDRNKDTEATITLEGAETLQKDLNQINISVLKYVKTSTVLVKNHTNEILQEFYSFIDAMLLFWSLETRHFSGYETLGNNDMIEDIIEKGNIKDFQQFLNEAGIKYQLKEIVVNGQRQLASQFGSKLLNFWETASAGTHSLTTFYYWLERIKEENSPKFIFIDEFDAFYHQSLAELVVKKLKEHNCQVIFTTHNTGVMNNDLLRPDCYFLMFKDRICPLFRLTNKDLRFAHNIEKMYRAGSFNE